MDASKIFEPNEYYMDIDDMSDYDTLGVDVDDSSLTGSEKSTPRKEQQSRENDPPNEQCKSKAPPSDVQTAAGKDEISVSNEQISPKKNNHRNAVLKKDETRRTESLSQTQTTELSAATLPKEDDIQTARSETLPDISVDVQMIQKNASKNKIDCATSKEKNIATKSSLKKDVPVADKTRNQLIVISRRKRVPDKKAAGMSCSVF
ncbi:unnamed protein product [Anisakis simplex]|uniref:RAD51_interact domain-containing protein n=1 Tax=Anisakis simplex TaxID=6269 RepID=A0A0M3KEV6_ANISI|nr:unnamed protein product [Anisakis simplex]